MTSLAELQRAGITFAADEAVAIARKILRAEDRPVEPPFGPPALDNVLITDEGHVECRGNETTPSAAELAILLQAMLGHAAYVPGGLRYAIARALHEVDAPPFDSVDEFSATIARYESADADESVRRVVARWTAMREASPTPERRRNPRSPADLRRHLREADRRLYETEAAMRRPPAAPPRRRASGWIAGAFFAGGLTAAAVAALRGPAMPAPPPPPESAFARGEPLDALALSQSKGELAQDVLARPRAVRAHVDERRAREARGAREGKTPAIRPAVRRVAPKRAASSSPQTTREKHKTLRLRLLHKVLAFRDDLP